MLSSTISRRTYQPTSPTMQQHGLTVVTEILPEMESDLKDILNEIGHDIDENPHLHFYHLDSVHFLRWVIVPATTVRGNELPAQLVLSTNYDGPLDDHLLEIAEKENKGIRKVYTHCKGFPTDPNPEIIAAWLKKHGKRNAAFYVGTVGKSQPQIKAEHQLREKIETDLQHRYPAQDWSGKSAGEWRAEIRSRLEEDEQTPFWKKKHHDTFLQNWGMVLLIGGVFALLAAMVIAWIYIPVWSAISSVLVVGFFAFWFWRLRVLEKRDAAAFVPYANVSAEILKMNKREDYRVQNQITHLVTIKPGWVRQFALRTVLFLINILARTMFNKGNLAGIRSIHFARWVILDGGKRLLFFSNYDGSWESYLGEFIDRAAVGLTGVWSNTEGFPPTTGLVKAGARHSIEFKAWVRKQQIETQVWFSAYKTISVENVNNNTSIRNGLTGQLTASGSRDWLQKL